MRGVVVVEAGAGAVAGNLPFGKICKNLRRGRLSWRPKNLAPRAAAATSEPAPYRGRDGGQCHR